MAGEVELLPERILTRRIGHDAAGLVGAEKTDRVDLRAAALSASFRDDGAGNLGWYVGAAGAVDGAQVKAATVDKATGSVVFGNSIAVAGAATFTAGGYCYTEVNGGAVKGQFAANSGGSVDIRTVSNHPIIFHTNNIPRMSLDAAGNVGIGTPVPSYPLHVVGLEMEAFKWAMFAGNSAGVRLGGVGTFGRVDAVTPDGNSLRPLMLVAAGVYVDTFLVPNSDNNHSLGGASNRWSVVYAGTGTINTSDAREKTDVREFNEAELAAARELAAEIGVYQWLASVDEKGKDAARLHVGMTVQRAIEIMERHDLDPWRYGFICRDEITRKVKVTQTRSVQATEEVEEAYAEIEVRDGVPVKVAKTRTVKRPLVEMVAVIDEAGEPVMQSDEPVLHPVPVMVEEEYETEVDEPAGDRLGFRYDQLTLFILRGLL